MRNIDLIRRGPVFSETNLPIRPDRLLHRPHTFRSVRQKIWGGHPEANKSFLESLRLLDLSIHVNPMKPRSRAVLVLSDLKDLAKLVAKYDLVILGPNAAHSLSEIDADVRNAPNMRFLVPSEWVRRLWSSNYPEIEDRIVVFPVGTDQTFWRPKLSVSQRDSLLVYLKSYTEVGIDILQALDASKRKYSIVKYGGYGPKLYRSKLEESVAMIFVGATESQGLALQESWMMDVPTFVFATDENSNQNATLAPYLTSQRGMFWSSEEQLLQTIETQAGLLRPRESTVAELSLEATSIHFQELLKDWNNS